MRRTHHYYTQNLQCSHLNKDTPEASGRAHLLSTTYCINRHAPAGLIDYCYEELTKLASLKKRGLLFIETPDGEGQKRNDYQHAHLDYPTTTKRQECWKLHNHSDSDETTFSGPKNDGRWDLPRSQDSPQNKNTIVVLLFRHKSDKITIKEMGTPA